MLLLLGGAGVVAPIVPNTTWDGLLTVEFSTAEPLAATQSWEDITEYVRHDDAIWIKRGRSTEFDQFRTGTCDLVLDNGDRLFDPSHAGGPYFGDLTPGRRLRVTVNYDSIVYTLFEGFIEEWPQEYEPSDSLPVVPITAVDWFGFAAGVQFADTGFILDDPTLGELDTAELGGDFEREYSGARIERVAHTLGIDDSDLSIERGASLVQADTAEATSNLLGYMQEVEEAEDGFLFAAKDGTFTFLGRHSRFELPRMTTPQATFSDDSSAVGYQTFGFDYSRRYIINEARYSRRGGETQTVRDTASRDKYGRKSDTKTNLMLDSDPEVQSRAAYKVSRYAQPTMRPRQMRIVPLRDPAVELPVVLDAEVLDRVTVERHAGGVGVANSADYLIQTLELMLSVDDVSAVLTVSPVDVDDAANYLTLDVDQLDQEVLAY